jgi:hypothetical protein
LALSVNAGGFEPGRWVRGWKPAEFRHRGQSYCGNLSCRRGRIIPVDTSMRRRGARCRQRHLLLRGGTRRRMPVGRPPRRGLGHRRRGPSPPNGGRRPRPGLPPPVAGGRAPLPKSPPRPRRRRRLPARPPPHPPGRQRRCVMPSRRLKLPPGSCPVAGLLMGCGLQCGVCPLRSSSSQGGKGLAVALLQIMPGQGRQHRQLIGRGAP